jgi:two-component system C4-dicarboxylate transport sensor histidine kinase DctB
VITYEHLQELHRFAELGRVSASLLHEISNPLSAALLNLELSDQKSVAVRRAHRDIKLLRRYVEAARQQIRRQSRATNFAVQPQIDQLKRILVPLARKARVQLDITASPPCRLHGDPVKFQHIVSNLVINAIEAYREGVLDNRLPLVQMTLSTHKSWLTIRVSDRAIGIPREALPHVFEAFYTTKSQSGHGLGIGLAIVKRYVTTDFGGSIKVTSSRRAGTCFTVKVPVVASPK